MRLREHLGQEAWRKTLVMSGVGGEPLERHPPQHLHIIGAVARAQGGSQSGDARHGVVVRVAARAAHIGSGATARGGR
jgi:hypothetical protein